MRKLLLFLLVIVLFTGCGISQKYTASAELAEQTWKFQKPIFLENPNIDYKTARLWIMLNGLATGMTEEEIVDYLEELDKQYRKEKSNGKQDAGVVGENKRL